MRTALAGARIPHPGCLPRGIFPAWRMQAWWEFEQNDSSQAFLDSSDAGNTIVTTDATSVVSVAGGVSGRAMYRGGEGAGFVSRRMYIPMANTHLNFGASESFTVGCWIKRQSTSLDGFTRIVIGRADLVGTPATFGNNSYYLGVLDNNLRFRVTPPDLADTAVDGGAAAGVGVWQFVVGVCDLAAGLLRVYADGTQTGTLATASGPQHCIDANFCISHPQANDVVTGTAPQVLDRQFDGYVDKAFVVPRVLTPTEITYLYNGGAGRSFAQALADGIMVSAP